MDPRSWQAEKVGKGKSAEFLSGRGRGWVPRKDL